MININVSNSYLNFTRHLALKLSALLALAITVPAQAQNATWTGNGTDTNWTNAANWGGTAPLATGTLTFAGDGGAAGPATVNNFTAGTQFNGINFTNNGTGGATNTAFSLSGSSITVGGNITATSSTAAIQDTIANNLIFNANRNITANGNHTIRLTGDVILDSTTTGAKLITYNNAAAFSGAGGTIFFTGNSTGGANILSYSSTANATLSRNIDVSKTGTNLAALRSATTGALTYNGTFTAASGAGFELNGGGSGANDWQSNFGNGNNTATNVSKGGTGNWLISGAIQTGTGTVVVSDGNLTLTNVNNNFTGQVQALGNGTLNFTSGGALGSGTAVILLGSGPGQGVLKYTGSADTTSARGLKIGNSNTAEGTARINVASTGNLTFTSAAFTPTQAGYTTNRSLTLGGDGSGVGTIQGTIINASANSTTSLTKDGAGRWILSGNNTYTGTTTISAGTLQVGAGSDSGSIASSANIVNNGALVYNVGSGNRTYGNVISGTGSLTQAGTGTLTLSGTNTYNGTTTVSAGTLLVNGSTASGSAVNVASGAILGGSGTVGGATTLTSGAIGRAGSTLALGSTLATTGTSTLTANSTVNVAGGTTITSGTFTVDGTLGGGIAVGGSGNILNGSGTIGGNTTVNGGTINGSLSLGTLTATGNSTIASSITTISGTTVQSGGILNVNGNLGGGAVVIDFGSTLKGNGIVSGATTINGDLAPGASPGLLVFSNALTLAGTTTMEINGTTRSDGVTGNYDGINTGAGLLTYGGTLSMSFGATTTAGTTYDLFQIGAGSFAGSFTGVSISGSYIAALTNNSGVWTWDDVADSLTFTFTQSTGDLVVTSYTPVPEPSAYAALAGVGMIGFTLYRRRRQQKAAVVA